MSAKTNKATYDPSDYVNPSVFHFQRPDDEQIQQSVSDLDRDIAEQQQRIDAQRKMKETLLQQQKQQQIEQIETLRLQRTKLEKEAEDWSRRSNMYKSREDIDDALNRAAKCWDEITAIDQQLPAASPEPPVQETIKKVPKTLSTTWAVLGIVALVLVFSVGFDLLGVYEIGEQPENDSLRRMLNSAGFRMLLNVIFWASSILVAVSYLYFFNRDLWLWFHNRVNSTTSFQNDFLLCNPSDRLKFFTQNFWAAAFLFALCLLVILG